PSGTERLRAASAGISPRGAAPTASSRSRKLLLGTGVSRGRGDCGIRSDTVEDVAAKLDGRRGHSRTRGAGCPRSRIAAGCSLLAALLDVVLDELLCVLFEHGVDLVEEVVQLVEIGLRLLLGDLEVLDLFFGLLAGPCP